MPSSHKQDQRIIRTRARLATALLELTLEQGYEAVTIRDIVQRAGIGYATYFRHYADKESLLLDALGFYLAELIALIRQQPAGDGVRAGQQLFDFVGSREQLSRVFLLSSTSAGLTDKVVAAGMQSIFESASPRADAEIPADITAFHVVSASLALVRWWLEHAMPYPPAQMGVIYDRLVLQPALAAAFDIAASDSVQKQGVEAAFAGAYGKMVVLEALNTPTADKREDSQNDDGSRPTQHLSA